MSSTETRELKTDTLHEETARRSRHCSLKGLKFTGAWDVAHRSLTYPGERKSPFFFLHAVSRPSLCPHSLPSSTIPLYRPLRCSLCSPERPRPAINVMHPQTHPCPALVPIGTHRHRYLCMRETNTNTSHIKANG